MGFGAITGFGAQAVSIISALNEADQNIEEDFTNWAAYTSGSAAVGRAHRLGTITGSSGLAVLYRINRRVLEDDLDWDKDHHIIWYGGVSELPAAGNYFMLVLGGYAQTVGSQGGPHIGFIINDDGTVEGSVHDGTTRREVDLGVTVVLNQVYRFEVILEAGVQVRWLIDGVEKGSSTDIPTGTTADHDVLRVNGGHVLADLGTFRLNRVFYRRAW